MPPRQLTASEINRRQLIAEIQFHPSALKCRGVSTVDCSQIPEKKHLTVVAVVNFAGTTYNINLVHVIITR